MLKNQELYVLLSYIAECERLLYNGAVTEETENALQAILFADLTLEGNKNLEDVIILRHKNVTNDLRGQYKKYADLCKFQQKRLLALFKEHVNVLPEELMDIDINNINECINVFSESIYLGIALDNILIYLTMRDFNGELNKVEEKAARVAKDKTSTVPRQKVVSILIKQNNLEK